MIYKFISDEDILQQIKQDLLLDIISDETERQKKIRKAEGAVLKQIRSKAGKWYDMDLILISVKQWISTETYPEGKSVYDDGIIYECLSENSDIKPNTDTLTWKESDPRHELLVMYASDMTLYHLHSSVNPRKIPELRKGRYNEAMAWLELIADRTETPDFPEMESDNELIIWGSNEKQDNYF